MEISFTQQMESLDVNYMEVTVVAHSKLKVQKIDIVCSCNILGSYRTQDESQFRTYLRLPTHDDVNPWHTISWKNILQPRLSTWSNSWSSRSRRVLDNNSNRAEDEQKKTCQSNIPTSFRKQQ